MRRNHTSRLIAFTLSVLMLLGCVVPLSAAEKKDSSLATTTLVTYVINTTTDSEKEKNDGRLIRRAAIDNNVAIFTCLDTVKVLLDVLEEMTMGISVIDKE